MKVREPVARPLDVVALELLVSASQAFLVGVLMYLAIGIWDDRGVGFGPVAIILALLGAAVGGSWLYWLLGGMGWPMAAANVPVSMFLGFALVIGWTGDSLFRVEGIPLGVAVAAAVYGIVCGVFLDSPRRWRWDQRQKLRPGTTVPRVSSTTQALVAQVPRSLPRRATSAADDLATRIGQGTPPAEPSSGDVDVPYVASAENADASASPGASARPRASAVPEPGVVPEPGAPEGVAPGKSEKGPAGRSTMPTERPESGGRGPGADETRDRSSPADEDEGGIELPTSIEPKAQRSPWAWAAPPEWNRDEDDEPSGSSSRRS